MASIPLSLHEHGAALTKCAKSTANPKLKHKSEMDSQDSRTEKTNTPGILHALPQNHPCLICPQRRHIKHALRDKRRQLVDLAINIIPLRLCTALWLSLCHLDVEN